MPLLPLELKWCPEYFLASEPPKIVVNPCALSMLNVQKYRKIRRLRGMRGFMFRLQNEWPQEIALPKRRYRFFPPKICSKVARFPPKKKVCMTKCDVQPRISQSDYPSLSHYCWWFRNPANQLRLVVFSRIYTVLYISGGTEASTKQTSPKPLELSPPFAPKILHITMNQIRCMHLKNKKTPMWCLGPTNKMSVLRY